MLIDHPRTSYLERNSAWLFPGINAVVLMVMRSHVPDVFPGEVTAIFMPVTLVIAGVLLVLSAAQAVRTDTTSATVAVICYWVFAIAAIAFPFLALLGGAP